MFSLARFSTLKRLGIVGMNKRNVEYIAQNNPRHLYPRVDDKLQTKLLCHQHNIATPTLLGVCRVQGHVNQLESFLSDLDAFVIKPAKGSGGKGILVINRKEGKHYFKPSGAAVDIVDIQRHASNILSGLYSLGGKPDVAVIEALVEFTDDFEGFSFEGVPDVRVIVYKGYPIMAMMRLSTHESDGKANLHQGAVGVGINIANGWAMNAVQHARPLERHPDTGKVLRDLVVPRWDELMHLASRSYDVTGLGYIGADIVLDKRRGPLLLELNARPGLSIQVANGKGLIPLINRVDELVAHKAERTHQERVALAADDIAHL